MPATDPFAGVTVREKQSLFAKLLADLIVWIYEHPGWEISLADGSIDNPRKVRALTGGLTFLANDAHHMPGSLHYLRLAQDFNLFINGSYIAQGDHQLWEAIGKHWEGMHPLCAWGGRFGDSNHFSLHHEGRQ